VRIPSVFPSIPARFVNRREGKRSPRISGISADCVEIGNHFRGDLKHRRLKILAKMLEGRHSAEGDSRRVSSAGYRHDRHRDNTGRGRCPRASRCRYGGSIRIRGWRASRIFSALLGRFPHRADAVAIPIVAAGGIADARGIVAAFALGAEGVQMGTVFLACEESGASSLHRDAILSGKASRTSLTRGFTGRLARGIHNQLLEEMNQARCRRSPVPAATGPYAESRRASAAGRT
jgi:hypothetical protein